MLGGLHSGAEAHRYCLEHQALEEVTVAGVDRAADASPGVARAPGQAAAHEACPFAAVTRGADRVVPAPPATAPAVASVGEPPPPPVAPRAFLVLSVAPKTSPPRVAV